MRRKSDKATHKDSFALPRVYRLHFLYLASRANKQLQTVGSPKYQADKLVELTFDQFSDN